MLAMLLDVAERDFGIYVDFFGAPAFVSSAPARVALRTNAWVMPAVVIRGPGDDRLMTPIIDTSLRDYTPTGDTEHDVRELTRLILRSLEGVLRAHPDQWFIFRRMWQQPAGDARPAAGELAEGV
jgi:KDO2-lipid IV(A) lauroyltransferase